MWLSDPCGSWRPSSAFAQATRGVDPAELVAVAVDVGKHAAMALVCDFGGELLAARWRSR